MAGAVIWLSTTCCFYLNDTSPRDSLLLTLLQCSELRSALDSYKALKAHRKGFSAAAFFFTCPVFTFEEKMFYSSFVCQRNCNVSVQLRC